MAIDWFTFTAQIINFLVLVALLRRFLYGPVVRAMQEREERIASRLGEAERARLEADEKARLFESKNRELDEHREERLRLAHEEAHEHRDRLRQQSHEEQERRRSDWLAALDREREELTDEFRRQIGQLAEDAARHTLAELASDELEERMLRSFLSRLRGLDELQTAEAEARLPRPQSPQSQSPQSQSPQSQSPRSQSPRRTAEATVRTAFDVPERWRSELRQAVAERFGPDLAVSFEQAPELICGIELDVDGFSFGWNVNEHLRQLRLEFAERLRKG